MVDDGRIGDRSRALRVAPSPLKALTWSLLSIGATVGWLGLSAAPGAFRDGYLLDEELTTFAVRGISLHGLPTLRSGVFYQRGLPYSYVAALFAQLLHLELPAFRIASLLLGT